MRKITAGRSGDLPKGIRSRVSGRSCASAAYIKMVKWKKIPELTLMYMGQKRFFLPIARNISYATVTREMYAKTEKKESRGG